MKKILITGPILSRSGYGEMARFALRSLKTTQNYLDLYLLPTSWGNTGWLFEDNDERRWIESLIMKTQMYVQSANNNPSFDISLQISIPNEWKKIAPINIGYTAGIETTMVSPAWLEPSMQMDKIIVIIEHAKTSFVNTIFGNQQGQQFRITTPIDVVHLPYRDLNKESLDIDFKYDFNYLSICQWSPRKNMEQTIVGFLEEFANEEVGLVLKINTANDSIMDREHTKKRLEALLSNFPNRKCSITLLHGHLRDEEMLSLYNHPKIKSMVSITKGEGFGRPLLEFTMTGKPVIASNWSGHKDFLSMESSVMIGGSLTEVDDSAVDNFILKGSKWFTANYDEFSQVLILVKEQYDKFLNRSEVLRIENSNKFSLTKMKEVFSSLIQSKVMVPTKVNLILPKLNKVYGKG